MTYTIPGIPPSNNEYIGRTNYREYQPGQKRCGRNGSRYAAVQATEPFAPVPVWYRRTISPDKSDAGILTQLQRENAPGRPEIGRDYRGRQL